MALQQVTEPVPKLSERLQPMERRRWQAVIDRVLAKEPRHRFMTADSFTRRCPSQILSLSDQSQCSRFLLAIDAALVSARHSEETVEQVVLHTNVEQWIIEMLGTSVSSFG